jgi:hypothetical protein
MQGVARMQERQTYMVEGLSRSLPKRYNIYVPAR